MDDLDIGKSRTDGRLYGVGGWVVEGQDYYILYKSVV
jgi:hypothetical protein